MPITALLFDLDNTLYSAHAGITEALEAQMNAYVQQLTGLSIDEAQALRQHYFVTYGTTLRGLQLHHDVDIEHYLYTVHQFDAAAYVANDAVLYQLLAGDSRRQAIFTNSPREHAERVLCALGIDQLQLPIIDIRAMNFVPKPHLSAYQTAMSVIGQEAAQIAFFEDTLHNLEPAKQLGMTTVYLHHGRMNHIPAYVDYSFVDIHVALRAFA